MELTLRPATEYVVGRRVELRVETAEIVVDRCGTENTDTLTLPLHQLEPLRLNDDTQALNEEDATEKGQQQLLMDDDRTDTDDAANGQRSRVAHEHLSGIGVIPQETNHGSDKRRQEHYEFFGMRNIHDIEVGGIDDVT